MAHYRLFNTDRFLELAPRWGEAAGIADWGPWSLLGIIPACLILWLYRYEIKLAGGLAARALLGLRLLVLALLLFLVFWQPRVGAQVKEKAADRVLVLVDRTASMDVNDSQRPTVEKLRLAHALKLCTDIVTDDQLSPWIAAAAENREPQWVADEEAANAPDTRLRLTEERRRLHQKVLERVDGWTRAQMVKRLLEKDGGKLLADLGGRFQVQLLGFAHEVSDLTPEQLDELFRWPTGIEKDPKTAAEKESVPPSEQAFTDFKPALKRALETAVQGNGSVRGVILLTDGRQNSGDPPLAEARALGQNKVPVYPVVVGSRDPRPGITVARLEAPRTLLKDPGDAQNLNAVIRARVNVKAVDAQPIVVELYDGKKMLDRKTIDHPGGTVEYPVDFLTALSEEGTHKLTVKVQPPKGLKESGGLERSAETQVVKDQADVLVIDGEARWEYHYLTVALGRDKLIKEVRGVVFDQPRIDKVKEDDLQKANWPALKLPEDPAALTGYDCIVLGDVSPEQLPMKDRERLQSYVRDAGGTLVVVAGKHSMPLGFPKEVPGDATRTDPIMAMLPISEPHVVQSRQGFPVTLTSDGRLNPLLQLSDRDSDDDPNRGFRPERDIWAELPPHYWAVVGKKKPAATTLAFYPGEKGERPADAPKEGEKAKDTKKTEEANSLIAWHTYGRGRVLYVGLDSTWRWRYKVGDQHHHRFWGQLVRWAVNDKLLPGGAGKVRFGTPEPTYETGKEIDVRLRLDKSLPVPDAKSLVVARILRVEGEKTEKASVVTLSPRAGQPRTLEGKLRDLPAGAYKIELDFGDLAAKLGPDFDAAALNKQAAEFVIGAPTTKLKGEMADVTADVELLQQVALLSRPELADAKLSEEDKKTGARVYTLDTAREILDNLKRQDEEKSQPPPAKALWEWSPTLLLILGLLTVEWVGRKWAGLP